MSLPYYKTPGPYGYGVISLSERAHIICFSVISAFHTAKVFVSYITQKTKSWKRYYGEAKGRLATARLNIAELQHLRQTTYASYQQFTAPNAEDKPSVDAFEDSYQNTVRLMWIGPKRRDKVILYIHGGGYVLAMSTASLRFWNHIQLELKSRDVSVGIVALNYTIYPDAPFPVVLSQIVLAVNHLLDSGLEPQNLYLAGDSAGAGAIMQMITHILHPEMIKTVPSVPISTPLGGLILISPWIVLTTEASTFVSQSETDAVSPDGLKLWGAAVLSQTPKQYNMFVEAGKAPEGWFMGIDRFVGKIFVTAGADECMRDDILAFVDVLRAQHAVKKSGSGLDDGSLVFVLEQGGVHDSPLVDFETGEANLVKTTEVLVDWLSRVLSEKGNMAD